MLSKLRQSFKSLRFRIIAVVLAIFLLITVFSVSFFARTVSGFLEEQTLNNFSALVQQTNNSWSDAFALIKSTFDSFYSAQNLEEWLDENNIDAPGGRERMLPNIRLDQAVKGSLTTDSALDTRLINSLYFSLSSTCYSMYYRGSYSLADIMDSSFQIMDTMSKHRNNDLLCFRPKPEQTYFFVARSGFAGNESQLQMKLVINVDERTLYSRYQPLLQYNGMTTVLVDDEGYVYSSPDANQIGTQLDSRFMQYLNIGALQKVNIDGESYYASTCNDDVLGFTFLMLLPEKELMAACTVSVLRYVMVMLLVLALVFTLCIIMVFRSTRFIKDLTNCTKKIKMGDYSAKLPEYATTELADVSTAFREMANKIDYLINEVYEKQLAVNKADMRFLQSQINPHFLFNALATISTKAKLAKEDSIYSMITSLSTLMRASLRSDKDAMTRVSDELECVRCYLRIQKERFGDRFQYDIHVDDPDIEDEIIPRLCVEPLVENAVVHGFEELCGKGHVSLKAFRDGNELVFIITDNGPGFPAGVTTPDDLLAIGQPQSGIGLHNTNRRLKLIYGEENAIRINPSYTQGAQVIVRIPCKEKGEPLCIES